MCFHRMSSMLNSFSFSSNAPARPVAHKPVTEDCLECLCETQSGCDAQPICVNGACGIFRITLGFWKEAGELTLSNETSLSQGGGLIVWSRIFSLFTYLLTHLSAFTDCVNDPYCAANTIQNYMYKNGQDCNGDGKIDCLDFAALHKLGNLRCQAELPYSFAKPFNKCLKKKQQEEAKSRSVTK